MLQVSSIVEDVFSWSCDNSYLLSTGFWALGGSAVTRRPTKTVDSIVRVKIVLAAFPFSLEARSK
jgi:hypothetical protein